MSDDSPRPKFMANRDKTVRLDSVATASEVADPTTKVGLLELFRTWLRRSPEDRRIMPRHATYEMQIWIGWCRDEQSFFASLARLVNVSRGGALVNVPDAPVQGKMAWVCLGEPEPKDCIEAKVLEVRTIRPGEFLVRLEFAEPCPHEFFEAAVCMLPQQTSKVGQRARKHEAES